MKSIFTLDSWMIFLFMLVPNLLPDNSFGLALTFIFVIIALSWIYNLGVGLYKKLPKGHTLNILRFKFFFFFCIVYFAIAIIVSDGGYSINNNNIGEYGALAFAIIPLHLFSIFCVFYCMYFLAKALICAFTQNKDIQIGDYIGYFFGFGFLPIGIWFIQPKIKRLFAGR